MQESSKTRQSGAQPVRQRSAWERGLVWGGILLLLAVVLIEWTSRRNYDATLSQLEAAIVGSRTTNVSRGISLTDAERLVKGFAFRGVATKPGQRQQTYRWPSLFKVYKLGVTVDDHENVTLVEACLPESETEPTGPVAAPAFASRRTFPKRGFPKNAPLAVAINTNDVQGTSPSGMWGSLMREVVRQGFLIAAREELGLATMDASLGESVPEMESAQTFPFDVVVTVSGIAGEMDSIRVDVELSRPNREGKWLHWASSHLRVPVKNSLESLVEQVEASSRNEFVQALRDVGFQKSTVPSVHAPQGESSGLAPLDAVSQFGRLRQLHPQMRSTSESAATIGSLVCAYANLGNLVDFHWGAASKAFKARALLYAQRFLVKQGRSPLTLAHRAYARGLSGRHATALDDVQGARDAKGPAAPPWLDLIEAFCAYKPDVLDRASGEEAEFGAYLRMRLADPVNNVDEALSTIQRFASMNPASLGIPELLCEVRALGIRRMVTERGFDEVWPDVYGRLESLPDLPVAARKIAEQHRRKSAVEAAVNPNDEHLARMQFIKELFLVQGSTLNPVQPSWTILAELLRDVTFLQVWRQLDVEANALAVGSDQTLAALLPLIEGHPLERFAFSFASNSTEVTESLQQLCDSNVAATLELPAAPLAVRCFHKLNRQSWNVLIRAMMSRADATFEDLNPRRRVSTSEDMNWGALLEVSPFQPASIVWSIEHQWETVQDKSREWEQTYRANPLVLKSLAKMHQSSQHHDAAIRCLNQLIDDAPTHAAYRQLADVYQEQGDLETCKESLEHALDLPNYGLEDAQIRVQLAQILMREGDWDAAQAHATIAANSYAGWALLTAGRCAEGIEDWDRAEACHRAASERYQESAADWYFWCLRTGRGNVTKARALAKRYWQMLSPPFRPGQRWSRGVSYILIDNLPNAILTLTDSIDNNRDLHAILLAAILADKADDAARRDALFDKVAEHWSEGPILVELVNLFRGALAGKDGFEWNKRAFESLAFNAASAEVTFHYYLAGEFVGQHGQQELSREYLECAATSFDANATSCMLANRALRLQQIRVGVTRAQELPDALAPLAKLINHAHFAAMANKDVVAFADYAKVLELRSGFIPALAARGRLHENLENYAAAIADYNEALRIDPDCETAHSRLASLYAACERGEIRNGELALKHAKHVFDMRKIQTWGSYAMLAAANAECGNYAEAVALEMKSNHARPMNAETWARLALYRDGKPYRREAKRDSPGDN
jgi:tetratricopeptide (TPR) repeat protein